MSILGINAYHGDVSAVLLRDGMLVAAVEEERFRRIKHRAGFPREAIRACLDRAGVQPKEVDHFAISRDPKADLLRKALFTLRKRPSPGLVWDRVKHSSRVRDVASVLSDEPLEPRHEASRQMVFEEASVDVLNALYQKTRLRRLCLAGGCAMNSVMNGKIREPTPFEEVYIRPAAGDNGTALGAAFYVWHQVLDHPRRFVMEHAYWGPEFTDEEIGREIAGKRGGEKVLGFLASICPAFWIDLKRCLRSKKAHIEFHEKVHLSQDHWHVCRLCPCKRELYRRKR